MTKEDEIRNALEAGLQLLAGQQKSRQEIREKSKQFCGDLIDAHLLATSVIGRSTSRTSGKPGKKEADLHQRLALSASFIQGIDLCETAISEGLYVVASGLLKQEMETIAAIWEVRDKNRKRGRTPNVKTLGKLAVLYDDLNKLAHVGEPELLDRFVGHAISSKQSGAALFPHFDPKVAKHLYGLHVVFITMIAIEVGAILEALYGAGLEEIESDMLIRVAQILQQEGWLPPKEVQ